MDKFLEIRKKYPVTEKCIYLDTATSGLISTESYNKIRTHLDKRFHDGMDIPWVNSCWENADKFRERVAEMVNADADEIFFEENCSAILNVFSSGIDFLNGSNIVTSNLSFPSTPYAWMHQAKRGIEVRFAKAVNGMIGFEKIVELVDEKTAAISLCYVENTSGFRHDLDKIGKFCQERGILLVIDATQCIAALKIDVKKMHIDFLAVSSYKWLNNLFGIGFGYVSKNLINRINQSYVGWVGNVDRQDHSEYKIDLAKGAQRFEMGGLNWTGLGGMDASIKTYMKMGKDDVEKYILELTDYIYQKVSETSQIELVGPFPKENRSGISYIIFPKSWKLNDDILYRNNIRAHIASENTMRISCHFYNNKEDIDGLFDFFKACEKNEIIR